MIRGASSGETNQADIEKLSVTRMARNPRRDSLAGERKGRAGKSWVIRVHQTHSRTLLPALQTSGSIGNPDDRADWEEMIGPGCKHEESRRIGFERADPKVRQPVAAPYFPEGRCQPALSKRTVVLRITHRSPPGRARQYDRSLRRRFNDIRKQNCILAASRAPEDFPAAAGSNQFRCFFIRETCLAAKSQDFGIVCRFATLSGGNAVIRQFWSYSRS
jgi:hypothetical protein